MNRQAKPIYEFGPFRLDASRHLLLRGGQVVPLTTKAFDTLLALVEQQGRLVDRDELFRRVWPDTTVEEGNLTVTISMLRKALSEGPAEHRYIETVPRRGYRFVASVREVYDESADLVVGKATGPRAVIGEDKTDSKDEVEAEQSSGQKVRRVNTTASRQGSKEEGESPDPVQAKNNVEQQKLEQSVDAPPLGQHGAGRRSKLWPVVLVVVIVATLAAGAFYLWRMRTATAPLGPIKSIAVLPFKPLDTQNRDESFEFGMADMLITKLSSIKGIIVRPISAVLKYRDPGQDPLAAGREQSVDAVLDGSIQRDGKKVRITVRLMRVQDGAVLWTNTCDEQCTDIFALQDSISERVASELALTLTGEERELLAKRYTADPEAYDLYMKGRVWWSQANHVKARELFEEAVWKDPSYALAYAGIANSYTGLTIAYDVASGEASMKAKEAINKALELDGQLGEAHTVLVYVKLLLDWDWEGAEKEARRALEIRPNYSVTHQGYAVLLSCLGRHEEALDEVDRALELDPHSPLIGALKGQCLFLARRYQQAIEHLHRTLKIHPNFWVAHLQLGRSYEQVGRYEEALQAFRRAREVGGTMETLSLSGYTHAVAGRRDEAVRILGELKTYSEQRYVPPYYMALIHHGLGNSGEALRWLEKAYEERDARMVLIGVDPKWDALRNDPQFAAILKRMGLG
jgi:DNA-binding winged helix-turn-helix (wHTH) protein/TolB-like protein/Flp pilus assembly protein TadD